MTCTFPFPWHIACVSPTRCNFSFLTPHRPAFAKVQDMDPRLVNQVAINSTQGAHQRSSDPLRVWPSKVFPVLCGVSYMVHPSWIDTHITMLLVACGGFGRGGWGCGVGGRDTVFDSTLLMVDVSRIYIHVAYVLIRCALVVVHELILLLLRSSWFMYMKWHTCWYAVHSSWYMSWYLCCYAPHGSCTWNDIRVDTLFTLRGTWVNTFAATLLMVHLHEIQTCWYAGPSSWYMSWNFCCYAPHGSCTWSDIRVDTPRTLRNRRKFKSQTSNNMDTWKAESWNFCSSWEESEKRREEERRKKKEERKKKKEERKSKKQKKTKNQKNKNKKSKNQKSKNQKKQVSGERRSSVQKGRKSRNTVFFPMICGSGGSTSRLAQAAGAEPAGQMRVENCTRLWRQAHFQVKMYKTPQLRSTFRSCDVGKVHAVVARSTFRSQSVKNTRFRTTVGRSDVVSRGRRKGLCTLSKMSKTWGFCSISKNDGRRGTFEEDLQRCIFRGRRSTRDMFIRDVRRSGRWFPERDCILEHQIFRFAEMILRDRCSTSYDLASLFRGRRSTLDSWSGKIANLLVQGRHLCTQLSIFEGSLAELFRFWCCQLPKMRKSSRIVSFSMLSSSNSEEVSQNCFVFDVAKFKNWKSLAK